MSAGVRPAVIPVPASMSSPEPAPAGSTPPAPKHREPRTTWRPNAPAWPITTFRQHGTTAGAARVITLASPTCAPTMTGRPRAAAAVAVSSARSSPLTCDAVLFVRPRTGNRRVQTIRTIVQCLQWRRTVSAAWVITSIACALPVVEGEMLARLRSLSPAGCTQQHVKADQRRRGWARIANVPYRSANVRHAGFRAGTMTGLRCIRSILRRQILHSEHSCRPESGD